MRWARSLFSVFTLSALSSALAAQQPGSGGGGTITGVVRDSAARPVGGADVVAVPDGRRARTDSTGRFTISGLGSGSYTVRARKFGYSPAEWTADLTRNGHLEVTLTLTPRLATLDTMFTRADGQCSILSLDGFTCRRQRGKGLYLDYTEIDDKGTTYTADLFRDIEGFRVDLRPTRTGIVRVPVPMTGWRCLNILVDGRPTSAAVRVPEFSGDVVAMEIYRSPDDVPKEYERYTWSPGGGRCSVAVFWTPLARLRP
jgi:hypothetical protein